MFISVYRLKIYTVMLEFSTQLCELLLLNLLSGSTQPPPPLPCVKVRYIKCVAERGWGMLTVGPLGDHILQELTTVHLTRYRTYKIARPRQTKTKEASDR